MKIFKKLKKLFKENRITKEEVRALLDKNHITLKEYIKIMKSLLLILVLTITSLTIKAQCEAPPAMFVIDIPFPNQGQINQANNKPGDKEFEGNGTIPSSVTFNGNTFLIFNGVQIIESTVNINEGQTVYVKGNVTFNSININKGKLIVEANSQATILNLINNGGKLLGIDQTATINGNKPGEGNVENCAKALPVLFENISSNNNVITWRTTSEFNNKEFNIYVSTNAKDWVKAGTVKAENMPGTYTFSIFKMQQASLVYPVLFLLSMILLGFIFNKGRKFLIVPIILLTFFSCSKDKDVKKDYKYFYLEQVDLDGATIQTKVYELH